MKDLKLSDLTSSDKLSSKMNIQDTSASDRLNPTVPGWSCANCR